MKLFRLLVVAAIAISVLACGVHKKSAAPKLQLSDMGFTEDLEAIFYYTEGIKASSLYGDTARAMNLLKKTIEKDSTHSAAFYEAAGNTALNNPLKALEYSLKANMLDSTNSWYQGQLGRLLVMNERYDDATKIYKKLVLSAPHNPENYRMLAALYENDGLLFSAISVLDSAEHKLGRMEGLSDFKRRLLINVKLYDKAIEESQQIINDNPYDDRNYLILAELYAKSKKDSLALANFNYAERLNPTSIDIIAAKCDFFKRKGDNINYMLTARSLFSSDEIPADAKIDLFKEITVSTEFYRSNYFQINLIAEELLKQYPGNEDIFKLYADHLIISGEIDKVLELYKQQVDKSAKPSIEVFNNILDIEAYKNRQDSVSKYSDLALSLYPKSPDLYLRKAAISNYLKNTKQAAKDYKYALKYAQSDSLKSIIYGSLGDVEYYSNKNPKKCYSYYSKALKLNSENSMVLNNFAYFLSEENKELERALEMTMKSNKIESSNATYLDTYAWVLYKLERYDEAKKVMQQAISLDRSNSQELAMHYGDILFKLKDYFMASVYWKKSQERGYDKDIVEEKLKSIEGK